MAQFVTVQALRDAPLHPSIKEGEKRAIPKPEADFLIALGWVKLAPKPGRPKSKDAE
ncbi:hypothetical protein DR61_1294 [Burkholderia pseudomallei]|uniref:hypothetical protein n=1 Tax=Burkholderia TaxID=32008 RepID=UPI00050EECC5|nr:MULTISPECIES: hypothetical protein [Burkholderia]AIS48199.1 hypothetical protein DR61_1294 [Burkholderia pseudomallei]KGD20009.1 hypothetical protein DR60_4359 [Burkholderia pseudomallei]MBO1859355.1 hypothetical protein [Burkholderia cenocepacia]MDN7427776.1 hypothetical protein [Burkholderia sp. AU45388]MDR5646722.1 hypothetical protein [Burkholderia cenocepacia]